MERTAAGRRSDADGTYSSVSSPTSMDPDIAAIAPKSYMRSCGVLLPLVTPRGWVEIHCCYCKANTNANGKYFAGIHGLWVHLQNCSTEVKGLETKAGYDFIKTSCIKRELNAGEGEAIRKDSNLIPKLCPYGVSRGTDGFDPDTYEDPIAVGNATLQLDHLRANPVYVRHNGRWLKICCYKCGCTSDDDGKVFETLDAISNHVLVEHRIEPPKRYVQLISMCETEVVDDEKIESKC